MLEKEIRLIDKSNPYSSMEKNILSKDFGSISFSSMEPLPDYDYFCNKCKKFPKLYFYDDDIIKITCNCNKHKNLIFIENIKEYFSKINLENDIEYLECSIHFNKKFAYYCKKCKKNLCIECCEKCLDHKGDIIDFNLDFDTKLSIKFISDIIYSNQLIINNHDENISKSDSFNYTIKLTESQNENNCSDKVLKNDDKIKKNPNPIFFMLEKGEIKKYYFDLFLVIINDVIEFPNFDHIENIVTIENFIIGHKDLFNEDIIFEYQETKKKINNEKKEREIVNELIFYDNLFTFIKNIDLEKITFLLFYLICSTENPSITVIVIILFIIVIPLYLLFSSLLTRRKNLYLDNEIYYNYFTSVNKGIEFKHEIKKLIVINIICLILHIIHMKNIYNTLKGYIIFSSLLYLIIYLFLNIFSIVNYLIELNILYRLTNSFQIFGVTLDALFGKNGNLIIPYKKRDKIVKYNIECRSIIFIIIIHFIYFIIMIIIYRKINDDEIKRTNPIKIQNIKNRKISNEDYFENFKKKTLYFIKNFKFL